MRLDRNIEGNEGRGKYALLKLRVLYTMERGTFGTLPKSIVAALKLLEREGILDEGAKGTESEFMLIRLKDKYAQAALRAYATEAARDDSEYANEIFEMANRAGPNSPWCKRPD